MFNPKDVNERKIQQAAAAGQRWQEQTQQREETKKLLSVGGTEAAEGPKRVAKYRQREADKQTAALRAGRPDAIFTERKVGPTLDLDDDPPTDAARLAGLPVGRLVNLNDQGAITDGFATAFVIASNLLITNHHVFASADECAGCGIQFGYERLRGVLQNGVIFRLAPEKFFHADETLDFALVGIAPNPVGVGALSDYRSLPLDPMTGKILVGQPISIIQYPDGGPKKYGVRNNELLVPPGDADLFLEYTTDTLPGSSGSPVFNRDWEVVAVHHSGVPEIKNGNIMTLSGEPWRKGMRDDEIRWIANEGARVSCIYQSLKTLKVKTAFEDAYAQLMKSFGSDFSTLPALQGQPETIPMDSVNAAAVAAGTATAAGRGMSIIVTGTGNFYFPAAQATTVAAAVVPAAAPAETPASASGKEKKIVFDPDYDNRPGYDADFLGIHVPHPGVNKTRTKEMLKTGQKVQVLDYHHYSLAMNKSRRTVMWAAANADYTKKYRRKKREEFGDDTWVPDPRILGKYQIMDQEVYAPAAKFDRGHVVRRDDVAWGVTAKEEVMGNSDSFHWTNCTPQHEAFNRDMFEYSGIGLWGMLENQISKQAKNVGNKLTIFAGPILADNDIKHNFGGGSVMIPLRFWKVVVVAEEHDSSNPQLGAYAFVLDQSYAIEDYGIERTERFDPGEMVTYQVTLADLSNDTGVTFDDKVNNADAMIGVPDESKRIRLNTLEDIRMG